MTRLALTFDAEHHDFPGGPPEQYGQLLDTLRDAEARATFFIQGRWARAWPSTARRIADEGHLVGLHGHSHVPYPRLSAAGVAADLAEGREAVRAACGVDPAPWFRLPYGSGSDDAVLLGQLRDAGFTHIHWTIDPKDWHPDTTADGIVQHVALAGAGIVLLHIWPAVTADALIHVLDRVRTTGADLVTVDQLDLVDHGLDP
jgi:peptidoglycan/xylan/chitin deacetylase (PgdA/CDA1 family)